MNIQCQCGSVIHDSTDDIPNKGYLVPDQGWCAMWDALDAAFDMVAVDQLSSFTAAERARSIFTEAGSRGIWQCEGCGTLYVEGRDRSLQSFLPSTSETDKKLLRKTSLDARFSISKTSSHTQIAKENHCSRLKVFGVAILSFVAGLFVSWLVIAL